MCTRQACIDGACVFTAVTFADVAGSKGCVLDDQVNIFDIFFVLDAFLGSVPDGCDIESADLVSNDAQCTPDGQINLFDIFSVLDAFVGANECCP